MMILYQIYLICLATACSVPANVSAQWFESLDACKAAIEYERPKWEASAGTQATCATTQNIIVWKAK